MKFTLFSLLFSLRNAYYRDMKKTSYGIITDREYTLISSVQILERILK